MMLDWWIAHGSVSAILGAKAASPMRSQLPDNVSLRNYYLATIGEIRNVGLGSMSVQSPSKSRDDMYNA